MTATTKRIFIAATAALSLGLAGCPGENAAQLLKTAEFEELQNNPEHARQLYEAIVKEHPDSKEANKARERLQALDQAR
jgi:TolA-binding protein